jgi:DNA polymerase sigma
VIDIVRGCVKKAFITNGRRVEVEPFGSFVNNLSTWNSDVDLVVTGVMEPDRWVATAQEARRATGSGLALVKQVDLAGLW